MTESIARIHRSVSEIDAAAWDGLLAMQAAPSPFMRHAYLNALDVSVSASPKTGWAPHFVTLWRGKQLMAACPVYVKDHSYGEYVFDWAWANAYEQHGLAYYPKAVIAVPFTPVPGTRLLARDDMSRALLVRALVAWCEQTEVSSLHLLFGADEDIAACADAGLMLRHTVQFHWTNAQWSDFDAFLASLSHDKRKKIRQERRKVQEAGVSFRWSRGADILCSTDWDFFYRCYARTYRAARQSALPESRLLSSHGGDHARSMAALRRRTARRTDCGEPHRALGGLVGRQRFGASALIAYGRYWGGVRARGLPAFRGVLLPAASVVHQLSMAILALRGRRAGRAQDGACPDARQDHQCPLAGAPITLPTRWSAFWSARARASRTTWTTSGDRSPFRQQE